MHRHMHMHMHMHRHTDTGHSRRTLTGYVTVVFYYLPLAYGHNPVVGDIPPPTTAAPMLSTTRSASIDWHAIDPRIKRGLAQIPCAMLTPSRCRPASDLSEVNSLPFPNGPLVTQDPFGSKIYSGPALHAKLPSKAPQCTPPCFSWSCSMDHSNSSRRPASHP